MGTWSGTLTEKDTLCEASPAGPPIAVFVHVHYPDVWTWMAPWIAQTIRRPFHLIVTTSEETSDLKLPDSPFAISRQVIKTKNRGRDIRPFLVALSSTVDYTIGLKLHTKKSTHRLDGSDWGRMLVHALLPDSETVDRLLAAMRSDPRLALVGPDGMLLSSAPWLQKNAKPMRRIAQRLGLPYANMLENTPVFSAGSMFWFHKNALQPLALAALDDLFEAERGQVDGTTAHAIERLFSPVAELSDGVVTTMEGVFLSDPEMTTQELRTISRRLADQPNVFLVPLPRYARFLLRIPGLRKFYQSLPEFIRRSVRNLRTS